MSHKPHLHTEKLSTETLNVINNLQHWLLQANYTTYVQGRADNPIQHGVYEGDDRFSMLERLIGALELDIQVSK